MHHLHVPSRAEHERDISPRSPNPTPDGPRAIRVPDLSNARDYREGQVVAGKYRLESLIGRGGMGTVWLARNEALDAPVAIKLIRTDLETDEVEGRLLSEARAAARIDHPGVVSIFDFGQTAQGDPFIVMELLDGRNLNQVLAEHGRVVAERAVQALLPVIDALGVAHRHGVVHRDLKPENILFVRRGQRMQPKIVDFGIAKSDFDDDRCRTESGTIMGSPGYMSPEQACGRPDVGARADVWSVCVVLYEALTGRLPLGGETYHAILAAIVADDPIPIPQTEPGDSDLWEIIKAGLEKDPAKRWQSMSDLGKALAHWLLSRGIGSDITGDSLAHWWTRDRTDRDDRSLFTTRPAVAGVGRASEPGVSYTPPRLPEGLQAEPESSLPPSRPRPRTRRALPWVLSAAALTAAAASFVPFLFASPVETALAGALSHPPDPFAPGGTKDRQAAEHASAVLLSALPRVPETPQTPPTTDDETSDDPETEGSAEDEGSEQRTGESAAEPDRTAREAEAARAAEERKAAARRRAAAAREAAAKRAKIRAWRRSVAARTHAETQSNESPTTAPPDNGESEEQDSNLSLKDPFQ